MDGRDAAQGAVGKVERRAVIQRRIGDQRNRLVGGVGNRADALAQVETPGLWRDVARRIAQPKVGLQVCSTGFGNDFAMPILAEAVGHHPVVAGDRPQPANREIAEVGASGCQGERPQDRLRHGNRRCTLVAGSERLDVHAEVPPRAVCPQNQSAGLRPGEYMNVAGRSPALRPGMTHQRAEGRLANHFRQRPSEHFFRWSPQDRSEVRAGMSNKPPVSRRREHRAVRLDGAGGVDWLTLAVRRVHLFRRGVDTGPVAAAHGQPHPRGAAWRGNAVLTRPGA